MTNLVNLNKARKRKMRDQDRQQADINRITFGRPKAERVLAKVERENLDRKLDGHLLAGDDAL
jgi:hypothetical protein